MSRAFSVVGGLATAGAATALAAFAETRAFVLHEVTVPVLPAGTLAEGQDAFTILHISDLHMLANQRIKQHWVAGLDALEPDLVVNTGDNLGEEQAVPAVLRALGPLLRRPGVFIFGSNDYYAPHPVNPFNYLLGKRNKPSDVELPWKGMRAAFVEHGWEDATHRRVDFATAGVKLAVGGVDDPHLDRDDYDALGGPPNAEADLAIGLSHSPEPRVLDEFAADGYQLMMSGHTHGGQLCLPGGRAIITNCGVDRSRASGLSRWSERMWLHVTNGLGTSKYVPFRTFCRPSATVVRVVERTS
ncbi:metallophosphoesterase [Corynebacterium sp.]|uniref:metallophosphoesterase n=1 Tax=Corynebacterium sp. TaxID=1720 RepID=UPI003B3BC844